MATATILKKDQSMQVDFYGDQTIHDILIAAGIPFSMPCAGNHSCGKCKIQATGQLDPISLQEHDFLSASAEEEHFRLACFAHALGDIHIVLDCDHASQKVLTTAALPSHHLTNRGWGIAVDIGTTTVVLQLYDLDKGALCASESGMNDQAAFGADVISRISYSNQHGKKILHQCIERQLNSYLAKILTYRNIPQIDRVVITGNTTMLHFWEDLDPRGIAVAPFTPQSLFGKIGEMRFAEQKVFLPPCIGSYIGADIVCSILASEMTKDPQATSLLIDMGTNGEIVVQHQGRLYCAATAMGPAFEGVGLDCGMPAQHGAVSGFKRNASGDYDITVIGDVSAKGICASGIIDIVAEMLDTGILDESGQISLSSDSPKEDTIARWTLPGTPVYISQRDIRQIQLAKAAVSAGVETILKKLDLHIEDIKTLYIAGGFGNYIDLENAKKIGLLPQGLNASVKLLGNGALGGAALILLDNEYEAKSFEICNLAEEIELSGDKLFSEYYMNNIIFET